MNIARKLIQGSLLGLTLFGVFYLGANCERWCPFGGVEALYTYVAEGDMLCSLGVANFFVLGGVLASALLVRRAFCGYLCPIGTISDWLRGLAGRLHIPRFSVPSAVDRWLSVLKYVLLIVILVITWRAGELLFRGFDPCYALISRHGPDITIWAYVVAGAVAAGSLVVSLPFCRWLCPLAAVLHPFSRFSLTRIRRHEEHCNGCGVCSRRCPMEISVDRMPQVTRADCLGCLACVEACPGNREEQKTLSWGVAGGTRQRWSQVALIAVLLFCIGSAVAASYALPIASFVRRRGTEPTDVATTNIQVQDLTCRGRANLFYYFLTRDDLSAIPGYLKVEAWPGPGLADVRISYDPACTDDAAIKRAITEPYFDTVADYWRNSPFRIEGYDPLDSLLDESTLGIDELLPPLDTP